MQYNLTSLPEKNNKAYFCCGIFNKPDIDVLSEKLGISSDYLKNILENVFDEELNWACIYHENNNYYFINCGNAKDFSPKKLKDVINKITGHLFAQKVKEAIINLPRLNKCDADWQLEKMILLIDSARYQLLDFKTKDKKSHKLKSIKFCLDGATEKSIESATAIAKGITLTRNLGNLPANICTPTYLANIATELDNKFKNIKTKILSEEKMQKMGMNSLLAVAKGSKEFSKLIEINYNGADNEQPIVLVGKGITFDSGGISLKPPSGMEEMKYDMCGAASVLGTIKAAALLNLPVNIIGLLACAENMPGGNAVKPGDVITSYSGQTIEITNTDAEGRLVLADTLTFAEKFNPKFVIDIATLTGAVIIALGNDTTGLMTNDEKLAVDILKAAEMSEDKAWRLPIDEKINELLESPVADMLNSPNERIAGTIVAACFLSRFTTKYRWAHLDIAGTAWVSGKNRTATGRPVPLLIQLIRDIANAS